MNRLPWKNQAKKETSNMTAKDIKLKLSELARYGNSSVYVPEFTFNMLRIDAIIINIHHRWIRGFEIKVNRNDFHNDEKWMFYAEFCSSLSIVCPEGLIQPEEIRAPFGLLWIKENKDDCYWWRKKPK